MSAKLPSLSDVSRSKGVTGVAKRGACTQLVPLAANNFDSDTFAFPKDKPVVIPRITVIDSEGRSIRFSILQS